MNVHQEQFMSPTRMTRIPFDLDQPVTAGSSESIHKIERMDAKQFKQFVLGKRLDVTHISGAKGNGIVVMRDGSTNTINIKVFWDSVVKPY